jgi:hypothetical protein
VRTSRYILTKINKLENAGVVTPHKWLLLVSIVQQQLHYSSTIAQQLFKNIKERRKSPTKKY